MSGSAPDPSRVDLPAYLDRIGYAGNLESTTKVLQALHLAHATQIPFENLDILLGRPIPLDLESLQAKLVRAGRGGYCFEQNLLFAAVLEQIGFTVTRLAARVRYRASRPVTPRTHMLMLVTLGEARWLADVGFGAEGLLLPVRFDPTVPTPQFAWTYRVVAVPDGWMLQSLRGGTWSDLYTFTLEPQYPIDYEAPNYYVSTHPESRFVTTLTTHRASPTVRHLLRNRELTEDTGSNVTSRVLADDEEVQRVLAEIFGLKFSAGTRFRYRP